MKAVAVLLLTFVFLSNSEIAIVFAQETPTPTPTPLAMPEQQINEAVATANARTGTLPADITKPGGQSIVPAPNLAMLFGYLKWLVDPATAAEYASPFAGIIQHIGFGFLVMFGLFAVYSLTYLIAYAGWWLAFLFHWFLRLVDIIMQIIQAIASVVGSAIDTMINLLTKALRFLRG